MGAKTSKKTNLWNQALVGVLCVSLLFTGFPLAGFADEKNRFKDLDPSNPLDNKSAKELAQKKILETKELEILKSYYDKAKKAEADALKKQQNRTWRDHRDEFLEDIVKHPWNHGLTSLTLAVTGWLTYHTIYSKRILQNLRNKVTGGYWVDLKNGRPVLARTIEATDEWIDFQKKLKDAERAVFTLETLAKSAGDDAFEEFAQQLQAADQKAYKLYIERLRAHKNNVPRPMYSGRLRRAWQWLDEATKGASIKSGKGVLKGVGRLPIWVWKGLSLQWVGGAWRWTRIKLGYAPAVVPEALTVFDDVQDINAALTRVNDTTADLLRCTTTLETKVSGMAGLSKGGGPRAFKMSLESLSKYLDKVDDLASGALHFAQKFGNPRALLMELRNFWAPVSETVATQERVYRRTWSGVAEAGKSLWKEKQGWGEFGKRFGKTTLKNVTYIGLGLALVGTSVWLVYRLRKEENKNDRERIDLEMFAALLKKHEELHARTELKLHIHSVAYAIQLLWNKRAADKDLEWNYPCPITFDNLAALEPIVTEAAVKLEKLDKRLFAKKGHFSHEVWRHIWVSVLEKQEELSQMLMNDQNPLTLAERKELLGDNLDGKGGVVDDFVKQTPDVWEYAKKRDERLRFLEKTLPVIGGDEEIRKEIKEVLRQEKQKIASGDLRKEDALTQKDIQILEQMFELDKAPKKKEGEKKLRMPKADEDLKEDPKDDNKKPNPMKDDEKKEEKKEDDQPQMVFEDSQNNLYDEEDDQSLPLLDENGRWEGDLNEVFPSAWNSTQAGSW